MARRVVLTGFMGTGKTVVGQRLAERLGWRFLDTDALIEQRLGTSIATVFTDRGEAYFREQERATLAEVAQLDEVIIATGGGALLSEDNRALFDVDSLVVCLMATPEDITRRLEGDASRPLLAAEDRLERVRALLADRLAAYAAIPHQVDTTGRTVDEVVDVIMNAMGSIYRLALADEINQADRDFVRANLRASNRARCPYMALADADGEKPLDVTIRDASDAILGGLVAKTYWGWLDIEYLWVDERIRGQGWGTRLMRQAEAEARRRGCRHARVGTFSFQARPFYEKLGYRVVGQIDDYPPGAIDYTLCKDLTADNA